MNNDYLLNYLLPTDGNYKQVSIEDRIRSLELNDKEFFLFVK